MDIKTLQQTLPWGAHEYNVVFRTREDPQRDAGHALLHVTKAAGKLADLLDAWDHDCGLPAAIAASQADPGKYLADLVICALRIANTWPGDAIDLDAAIDARLAEKFPSTPGAGA